MKIAALVYADLDADFFGAPSRLSDDLLGKPVLSHTLARLAQVKGLDSIILAAPPEQLARAADLAQLKALPQPVVQLSHRRPVSRLWQSMRAARTFSRYGWRGGVAGTCLFDESFDITLTVAAVKRTSVDALLPVSAGAALLDVQWAEELVANFRSASERYHVAFNQAPPGLGGAVFSVKVLHGLAEKGLFPGRLFGYDPARSGSSDPISQPYNMMLPLEVITTHRRFIAENPRGLWLCRKVMESAGVDADGLAACRVAAQLGPEPWPREVIVELTTRRPVTDALRGRCERDDISIDALTCATEGLQEPRDVNFVLAGGGDALLHPQWQEAARHLSRIGHVTLGTYGSELAKNAEAIVGTGAEIVEVYVDAATNEAYAAHKQGRLTADDVWREIEAFGTRRSELSSAVPLVVPVMLKNAQNIEEQEAFYRRAQQLTGWCAISEPSAMAGQWPQLCVAHMAAPVRTPCRRLSNRLTLLADGQVATCEEDLFAHHPLDAETLLQAWRSDEMTRRREWHTSGRWNELPLCATCEEFHRP